MEFFKTQFMKWGAGPDSAIYLSSAVMIVIVAVLSVLAYYIAKKIVLRMITHYIQLDKFKWDNIVLERKVFQRLSHVLPVIIIYYFSPAFPAYQRLIDKAVMTYLIITLIFVLDAALNAANDIYRTFDIAKARPIRGYIQVVKIFIFILGSILVISNLIGESPVILLSGIGALSAVFLLLFKDSLLGLVAGVQLTTNDMVRVGDWIEMSNYGANGEVIDISLNTVKVQNFDNTITMVPSYALISGSFKNWRGMQTSGGRRIMRSISIDISSIAFCTPDMLKRFKKIHYLTDYIEGKAREIEDYNLKNQIDMSHRVNGRALTNIGIFRMYAQQYLKHHPKIHQTMILMVRQLESGSTGLPLEIYAFTNTTDWVVYEEVQADLFDHLFAVLPEFGLRVFQNPTGHNLKELIAENSGRHRMDEG